MTAEERLAVAKRLSAEVLEVWEECIKAFRRFDTKFDVGTVVQGVILDDSNLPGLVAFTQYIRKATQVAADNGWTDLWVNWAPAVTVLEDVRYKIDARYGFSRPVEIAMIRPDTRGVIIKRKRVVG